ncbi:MAG: hypothetical protein IPK44_01790 [Candidatus Accumulibacter sp.]|uniref:hypothetical protein n=1 Tax=Accumulibacter sp. TaxID=2053492 RepID=UPI002586CAB0|nr:hypothetical protein [Accumulibacter sp.]MBK8113332.1 hypothetical protein [Accumulibacter sp.]
MLEQVFFGIPIITTSPNAVVQEFSFCSKIRRLFQFYESAWKSLFRLESCRPGFRKFREFLQGFLFFSQKFRLIFRHIISMNKELLERFLRKLIRGKRGKVQILGVAEKLSY